MPANKNQFMRFNIIDDMLSTGRWVKTAAIQRKIQEEFLETVSLKTIQNDLRDLEKDSRLAFYAPIEYNKKRGAYRYTETNFSIKRFGLRNNEITAFKFFADCLSVFSGYSVFEDFTSGMTKIVEGVKLRSRLKDDTNPRRIIQTDSLITAVGNEYLDGLVYAVDNSLKARVVYKSFDAASDSNRTLYPLFIKEYRNRWYLIAEEELTDSVKTFAFDRIQSVEITDQKFQSSCVFNPDEYFKHCFGITTSDEHAEEIILRVDNSELPWITSLPIHSSQKIVKPGKKTTDIMIHVRITYEVKEYILSKTPSIKVISPKRLATEIQQALNAAISKYC